MKTNEIIAGLRKLCGQGSEYRRTVCRLAADTLEAQQKRIEELEAACYHKRSADEVYASVVEALKYTPVEDEIEAESIWSCVDMDYCANAKKIVTVFLTAIVPLLKEMEGA